MCIIINKPAGVIISDEIYSRCFETNKDGAGFAVCENGKIEIRRGFFKKEDFLKAIHEVADKRVLAHFRWATHGVIAEHNCHPFAFEAGGFGWAVAHNGVLTHRSTNEYSDSACFVVDIIEPLLAQWPDFLDHDVAKRLMESKIGSSNKIVVMRSDGKTWILNEKAGSFDKESGVWYSNDGWKGPRTWTNGTMGGAGFYRGYSRFDDDEGYGGLTETEMWKRYLDEQDAVSPMKRLSETSGVAIDGLPSLAVVREVKQDGTSGLREWGFFPAQDFINEAVDYAYLEGKNVDVSVVADVLDAVYEFWAAICEAYTDDAAMMLGSIGEGDTANDLMWQEWFKKNNLEAGDVVDALANMRLGNKGSSETGTPAS